MHDQANHLRALVSAGRRLGPASTSAPRLIALAGGKGGVGVTTLAIQLAQALARDGRRTLLVDADTQRPDVAAVCQLADGYSVADVLSGRRTLHEAIRLGPGGIQILPGVSPLSSTAQRTLVSQWTPAAQERFIADLRNLGPHADVALLDVGSACDSVAHRFWQTADEVLLVTTPDPVSVLDAYAAAKTFWAGSGTTQVASVVNQVSDDAEASEVHERLRQACRRFLGAELSQAGAVPADRALAQASVSGVVELNHITRRELSRIAERCCPTSGGSKTSKSGLETAHA
jgi:flagellar biosynthesis protein FlhG